jgi:hypothetical protein
MQSPRARSRRATLVALLALPLLAACATSQLVQHQPNPEYVGKRFKKVLVIAATRDDLARRVFEDDAVARLRSRGIEGVPGYTLMPKPGAVDQARLKQLIAESGADGLLLSRVGAVDTATYTQPGYTAAVGVGWGGMYGYYDVIWSTVKVGPETTTGATTVTSETRLFDARTGTVAWTGTMTSTDRGASLDRALQQYIGLVFEAMAQDGVI